MPWVTSHLWQFGVAAVVMFIALFLIARRAARTKTE